MHHAALDRAGADDGHVADQIAELAPLHSGQELSGAGREGKRLQSNEIIRVWQAGPDTSCRRVAVLQLAGMVQHVGP